MSDLDELAKKRRTDEIFKLIEKNYVVTILDKWKRISVKFCGPKGTPYEDGTWTVEVTFSENYPTTLPSISFKNKIFHPNIDENGTFCSDLLNTTWSAERDLVHLFEKILPEFLAHPSPKYSLNNESASLLMHTPDDYKKQVSAYIRRFATEKSFQFVEVPDSISTESVEMISTESETNEYTFKDYSKLCWDILGLPGDLLNQFVSLVQQYEPALFNSDTNEIEIDFDTIRPSSIRKFQKYVDACRPYIRRRHTTSNTNKENEIPDANDTPNLATNEGSRVRIRKNTRSEAKKK